MFKTINRMQSVLDKAILYSDAVAAVDSPQEQEGFSVAVRNIIDLTFDDCDRIVYSCPDHDHIWMVFGVAGKVDRWIAIAVNKVCRLLRYKLWPGKVIASISLARGVDLVVSQHNSSEPLRLNLADPESLNQLEEFLAKAVKNVRT